MSSLEKTILHRYFDRIYIINLERRPDKLTKVLWQLERYQIKPTIIKAIDGYHPKYYYQRELHTKSQRITPGAYGYILSWRKVIEDAIQNQFKRILILDDDVILVKNFNQHFHHWSSSLPIDWKVILLGATQHTTRPPLIPDFDPDPTHPQAYYPKTIDGSFAVGLDHTVFHEILTELKKKNQLVDSDILRSIYRSYPNQCLVAYPNLMIADVTSSDIRHQRSQEQLAIKVGWGDLSNYHWPNQIPLVSIIVPCYQAEKTIQRCLNSILNQTYRPLELIVIDDGSQDQSFKIIGETFDRWQYHPKAKNISYHLIRHHQNQGCYAARNTGLKKAQGDLIAFQDADDISLDDRIEDQVNALIEHGVQLTTCLILRTHLPYLSEDPITLHREILATRIHPQKHCCRPHVGLATTLFRRDVFDRYGLYPLWKWGADDQYLRHLFPDLDPNYRMMNYLDENDYLPKIYYCVNKILYLSHEMTSQNLTKQRMASQKRSSNRNQRK